MFGEKVVWIFAKIGLELTHNSIFYVAPHSIFGLRLKHQDVG
jgi:hypothetical protein